MARWKLGWQARHNLAYRFVGRPPGLPDLPAGFTCRQITHTELDRLFADPASLARKLRYASFLDAGAEGFVVVYEGEWAAAAWISPRGLDALPRYVPPALARKHDWFFEAHTRAEFRGKGLHRHLVARRLQYLAQRDGGTARAVADIAAGNVPSRRSHLRLGFAPAGQFHFGSLTIPPFGRKLLGIRLNRPHPPLRSNSDWQRSASAR